MLFTYRIAVVRICRLLPVVAAASALRWSRDLDSRRQKRSFCSARGETGFCLLWLGLGRVRAEIMTRHYCLTHVSQRHSSLKTLISTRAVFDNAAYARQVSLKKVAEACRCAIPACLNWKGTTSNTVRASWPSACYVGSFLFPHRPESDHGS